MIVAPYNRKSWCDLPFRQVVSALFVFFFAFSNYAVQTHVHGGFVLSKHATASAVVSTFDPAGPVDNDEQHCPLCQEFLSGGNFLVPVALLLVLPDLVGSADMPLQASAFARAIAHSWQSRGPPGT